MVIGELFPPLPRRDHSIEWGWVALMIAAGFLSSVTFECVTPFAAFAALTAATMRSPVALATMAAIWVVNQALGFLALGYPTDGSTFAWGGAIGVAALCATLAAAAVMEFRHSVLWSQILGGFVAAFLVYEATLLLATVALGGAQNFTLAISAKVALSDAGWLVGIVILCPSLLWVGTVRHQRQPAIRT